MKSQPPSLLDVIALDLEVFNAAPILRHKHSSQVVEQILLGIHNAFNDLEKLKMTDNFINLQIILTYRMNDASGNQ